jgi:DNA sulfur modification protein DndC
LSIYDSLAKCFDTSSRSKEEAIANAHQKYDLKTAAAQGDIAAVKEQVEQFMERVEERIEDPQHPSLLSKPNNDVEENKDSWAKMKFAPKS